MSAVEYDRPADTARAEPPAERAAPVAPSPGPAVSPGASANVRSTIDIRQNRTAFILAGLAALVVTTVFAGLWLGHFAKTETVRGIVGSSRGFARFDAPKAGLLREIHVKQGDIVQIGAPLYTIGVGEGSVDSASAATSEIAKLQESRRNFLAEIDQINAFLVKAREQQASLGKDQKDLVAALKNQEKSVSDALNQAKAKLQRIKDLVQRGYATRDIQDNYERTFFEYERQYTDVKLRQVELRRQESDKQRELALTISQKESQKSAAAVEINSIDARIARVKNETFVQVKAQTSGQVLAVVGKVGDSVTPGKFVVAIGERNAEPVILLDAPARATGLVKPGQKVVLKYDAYPFKTFGIQHGTITSVSSSAVQSPSNDSELAMDARPVERQSLYRIEVRPDTDEIVAYGEKKKITLGSTLSADIVVERRRLIDWVLDPIRAMQGRT